MSLTLNSALGGTFTVVPPNVIGTVVATLPSTSGTLALTVSPTILNTSDYSTIVPNTKSVNLSVRQELKKPSQGYGCSWTQTDVYVTRGQIYQSYGYSWTQTSDVYTPILTN